MSQSCFVKNELIDRLTFSISSIESADSLVKTYLNISQPAYSTLYTIINRQDYLQYMLSSLNTKDQKLILLSGFQGTGKTELIKTALLTLEENILNFYYECSCVTNLDDLILSLHRYLHQILVKDPEYQRYKKNLAAKSVDKRLISYIKNLKRPLLITLDGFEALIKDDLTIKDAELLHFINYLLSLPTVKVIIASRRLPDATFNIHESTVTKLKLVGLDEAEVNSFLEDNSIHGGSQLFFQAYEATRGYPENLLLFIKSAGVLKLAPFDIIKEFSIRKESFEEYITKKMYGTLQVAQKRVMWFFATIRHPIRLSTLHKFNLSPNLDETLEYLSSNVLLSLNDDSYYLKDILREYIYANIPPAEKIKIHKFLYDVYTNQISTRLEDRILQICRRSLNSEQHYHEMSIEKIKKEAQNVNQVQMYTTEAPLAASYLASKYDLNHLSSNLPDTILIDDETNVKLTKEEKKPLPESDDEKIPTGKVKLENIDIGSDINVELTEEEKMLLQQGGEEEEVSEKYPEAEESNQPAQVKKIKTPDEAREEYIANAVISKKRGNLGLSLDYYKKALEIAELNYEIANIAKVSKSIANIFHALNKYEETLEYLGKSLSFIEVRFCSL